MYMVKEHHVDDLILFLDDIIQHLRVTNTRDTAVLALRAACFMECLQLAKAGSQDSGRPVLVINEPKEPGA